ncbi:hypothetical protein, partial [Mycoplasmopsis bovis]|uniref:hypothetical protein n=1 Tax=Mycoplasmopsis bovis TaxID=28903 RepID=UPI003D285F71
LMFNGLSKSSIGSNNLFKLDIVAKALFLDTLGIDLIEDLDKPLNINNNSNSRKLTQKQILLIFIPLGLLGATGIGTLIGFIYIRNIYSKIK